MGKSRATLLCVMVLVAGCRRGAEEFEATDAARRFQMTGTVRDADAGTGEVTVAHAAIPDFMDAMTMTFRVKERWVAGVATAGDQLTGTLVVDGPRSWIEGTSLTKPPTASASTPGTSETAPAIGPPPGTPLPDAPLVDQAGQTVRARDFAGRDLIITFIYTRCPLPDYCPRMLAQLNDAAARLEKAGRRDDVQMVAITIDPTFDTPVILDAYGRAHIKESGPDPFHRWSLLTGTPENVKAWASLFDLTYEKDGTDIAHGLRTAVADRDGKVVGLLRGNDWSVNDLMALLPSRSQ